MAKKQKEVNPSIRGVFKDGNGTAMIEAANGKYWNKYGYDGNLKPKAPAIAGGFRTYGQAGRAFDKDRPTPPRPTRDEGRKSPRGRGGRRVWEMAF